jgi:hypothetical protein
MRLLRLSKKGRFATGVLRTTVDVASCRVSLPALRLGQRLPQREPDAGTCTAPWAAPPVLPEVFTRPVQR